MEILTVGSNEKAEMLSRINLANRPSLDIELNRLGEVSGALAANQADRSRFLSNPASYLNQQAIAVSSCSLVETTQTQAQRASTVFGPDCLLSICSLADIAVVVVARLQGEVEQRDVPAPPPSNELL